MKKFMHRFAANKGALLGLVILCLVILTALCQAKARSGTPMALRHG